MNRCRHIQLRPIKFGGIDEWSVVRKGSIEGIIKDDNSCKGLSVSRTNQEANSGRVHCG